MGADRRGPARRHRLPRTTRLRPYCRRCPRRPRRRQGRLSDGRRRRSADRRVPGRAAVLRPCRGPLHDTDLVDHSFLGGLGHGRTGPRGFERLRPRGRRGDEPDRDDPRPLPRRAHRHAPIARPEHAAGALHPLLRVRSQPAPAQHPRRRPRPRARQRGSGDDDLRALVRLERPPRVGRRRRAGNRPRGDRRPGRRPLRLRARADRHRPHRTRRRHLRSR